MDVAPSGYQLQETVNPQTLEFQRAVKDYKQAGEICKRIENDNRKRNQNSAAIMRKYNDEQPWDPSQLSAAGQSWRSNRSTGFFSSIIKRIMPAYLQVIDTARVLTSSNFSEDMGVDTARDQKVENFRVGITTTIRRWNDWRNFCSQFVLEDVLYGWATVCWTDEYEWKPRFARTDEALYPDGAPQDSAKIPLWMLKQNFLIHELASKLKDPEASKSVGWFVDNVVKAINSAQPENRTKSNVNDNRKFEDTVREATIGRSYSEGVKVVEAYHLFAQEPTGPVSQYILEQKTLEPLFVHLDRFASMSEVNALFCVDIGNGKLQGSKGAGRILYNTAVAAEQARNFVCDNLSLSGLLVLEGNMKTIKTAAITVNHPVCILGEGYKVVPHQFKVDAESFFELDKHLTMIAEQQVGAFLPSDSSQINGQKETASAVNYRASVQQQIREGGLVRFYGQFQSMIFQMQKRICSPDNILAAWKQFTDEQNKVKYVTSKMLEFLKKAALFIGVPIPPDLQVKIKDVEDPNREAIDCCLNLLRKGLSAEEIYELAQCPTNEVTQDFSSQNVAAIDSISAKYLNDPSIRQELLKRKDIASKLGNTLADELIIPAEDQTLQQEATRQQILEDMALIQGKPVPVSPRDIHLIHMGVMQADGEQMLSTLTPQAAVPETIKLAENFMGHYDAHIQAALSQGAKPEALGQQQMFSKQAHGLIESAKMAMGHTPATKAAAGPGLGAALNQAAGVKPQTLQSEEPQDPNQLPNVPVIPNTPGPAGMPLTEGPVDLNPKITP